MRKLNDYERTHAREILEQKAQKIIRVMWGFRIFGALQILAIILYIILGDVNKGDIPFMLVGCALLYLIYFKLTNFLANKNQWKFLLKVVKEREETVYDCQLINLYLTQHGDSGGAKEIMANVSLDGKTIRCNASPELKKKASGSKVILICANENIEASFKYVM